MRNMMIWGGAILYGISPLDVIPDIAPPFTWIDDALVIYFAWKATKAQREEQAKVKEGPKV